MFCEACGVEIEEDDRYCRRCGLSVADGKPGEPGRSCTRAREGRMVAGVCAGGATYFGKDVTLIRIVWALAALIPPLFPGIVAYIVCWLLMPQASETVRSDSADVGTAAASK